MSIESENTKTALVTGASSGIGLELAKLLAKDGYNLVLVARRRQSLVELSKKLEEAHKIATKILVKDLASPLAPEEISAELQRESVVIDLLVNCAGFGAYGFFSDINWSVEANMIQVNLVALTHLTKLLLDGMLRRRAGKILNVASTAAFQPGPLMAVYYATKAYVLSFTEALAEEVKKSGVTVTALCPGATRTRFQEAANASNSRLFKSPMVLDAETVAKIGYKGLMNGERVVIPGFTNKLVSFAVRITPRSWATKMARRMNERT
jgi:short-subunit dehydrogenase